MALVGLAVGTALLAVLVFRASVWACLLCFTGYSERLRLCHMFVDTEGPQVGRCEEALTAAFGGLSDVEINYEERGHLHDAFAQMILSLQEVAAAQGSYKAVFPEAAEKMKKTILKLKEAQACVPPCGVQEGTRRFRCRGCYSSICDLPLDCPVQDVTVTRGNQALFSCVVGFQLPLPELTYSWKFAGGGLRTQDMAYFRDVPGSHGPLARIRPVQPTHRGTFSCVILQDQRPLARLYFFLNVTGPAPREEMELQVTFREVMSWAPREAEVAEPGRPSLGELLAQPRALTLGNLCLLGATAALVSASVTLLVW
ncbi:sperm acrosome membrane-associated protein 6 isoform X2 [Nannospalax galili]|nr:sperm acrosome membrane-associated protein 6 isoform X2 [Nannospalax galili]